MWQDKEAFALLNAFSLEKNYLDRDCLHPELDEYILEIVESANDELEFDEYYYLTGINQAIYY